MSSDLQLAAEELQLNNYISLVIATAVIYDYIITFSSEVTYIWNRSWTFVSTMFIFVRYIGLTFAVIRGLYGSIFIPGPALVSTVLLIISDWAFTMYLAAADIVMILRVYAMYNQSKIVMGGLLALYVVVVILYVLSAALYDNPGTYLFMTTPQILNMSFCNPIYTAPFKLGPYKLIPRLLLAALLFILVVSRFCMESIQTYKATKQWKVNRYLNLLVTEGIFYFLTHLLYCLEFGQTMAGFAMDTLTFVFMFTLCPRFIMNIRELHLHNLPHGENAGLDSGFGLSSRALAMSPIGFAESPTAGVPEEDVEMQVVGRTTSRNINDDRS